MSYTERLAIIRRLKHEFWNSSGSYIRDFEIKIKPDSHDSGYMETPMKICVFLLSNKRSIFGMSFISEITCYQLNLRTTMDKKTDFHMQCVLPDE